MAKLKFRNLFFGTAAVAALAGLVLNAPVAIAQMGLFFGYPIVGQSSYCITNLNPAPPNTFGAGAGQTTQCAATAPAGPSTLTGNELMIANTELPGGQNPQTVFLPSGVLIQHGFGGERNVLVGSDFQTNLWQRGTTPISATTASTTTMSADRWAAYSSGNTLTITKDVTAADVAPTLGVNGIMKVTRPSGTNTTAICVGQIMPVTESARFVGNEAVFSFYAEALAGYLQTGSTIIATIAVYTGADSATPGTITDSFMKGTTTGYTVLNPVAGTSTLAVPVLTGTSSTATIPLTTSLARYSVAAYVPPQVSVTGTLTNVTGIGVTLCTGVYPASTGVATDGFAFGNAQLEVTSAGALGLQNGSTVTVSQPVTTPGGYARRAIGLEETAQLAYTSPGGLGTEVAATFYMAGGCQATGNANFGVVFNPPLRISPTGATSTLTAGGYSIKTAAAVTAIGTMTVVGPSRYFATINSNAACTSTLPYQIVGSSTTGLILFSAEP